jgi:hypothetical protein
VLHVVQLVQAYDGKTVLLVDSQASLCLLVQASPYPPFWSAYVLL